MAAYIDRTRVTGKSQLNNWKHVDRFNVNVDDRRRRRGRHRDRDNGAANRSIALVYVPGKIEIIVVMDGRTMLMLELLRMVRDAVNVKRERLDLQRAQGQHDQYRDSASHSRSVFHGPVGVNAATLTNERVPTSQMHSCRQPAEHRE